MAKKIDTHGFVVISKNWMRDEVEAKLREHGFETTGSLNKLVDELTVQKIEYARMVMCQQHLKYEFQELNGQLCDRIRECGGIPKKIRGFPEK